MVLPYIGINEEVPTVYMYESPGYKEGVYVQLVKESQINSTFIQGAHLPLLTQLNSNRACAFGIPNF